VEEEKEVLVTWVKEMWWVVRGRQWRINWVGLWRKRMEREDKKKAKESAEKDKDLTGEKESGMDMILGRLKSVNEKMGM